MITCLQADHLPAIHCLSAAHQSAGSCSLTEVVCAALYGVPLKPGSGQGSLMEALQPLILEGWTLWKNPNGPGWLVPHLKLIADGKSWPFRPDTDDENERITLGAFRAAERWLSRSRRIGFVYGLPTVLAEKVLSLANMSEGDAISAALAEADRIERSEAVINARAAEFYKLLSDAVATRQITLKAIATDPRTNAWLPMPRGEPPHQTIPTDYFELPMVHNLFDNELEADRFSTEAKMLDSIFNRIERENEGMLIKWSDVKIPPEHADWLLSTFRGDGRKTGDLEDSDVVTLPANELVTRVTYKRPRLLAGEVMDRWKAMPSEGEAGEAKVATAAVRFKCLEWLAEQMRKSPKHRPHSKKFYYKKACKLFPTIGSSENVKPSRGFESAWSRAMDDAGCRDVWARAGAPKKSPH
jgi:hypothetical protein